LTLVRRQAEFLGEAATDCRTDPAKFRGKRGIDTKTATFDGIGMTFALMGAKLPAREGLERLWRV
jgi:hypothetical protein